MRGLYLRALLICFAVYSCSGPRSWRKELEKEWLGKSREELISVLGEPDYTNTTSVPGTEILIYVHVDFSPDIPPNNYSKDFFIGQKGLIYKVETYSW